MCRTKVRKTTTVYVNMAGKLGRSRVCNSCAKETITVHVGPSLTVCLCGEPAMRCYGCGTKDANHDRRQIILHEASYLRSLSRAYERDGDIPRTEALRAAADILTARADR